MMMKKSSINNHGKNILTVAFAAILLLLSGCASGPRTYDLPDSKSDYILGIGDTVRVTVYGHQDLSGEFKIEPNGMISYPLLKDIAASGFSAKDLEQSITDNLHPDYLMNPRVSVEVINFRNMYILGEVQSPGKYEYVPNMTVLQAVAIAGGYTYRAQESGAEVTRHVKGALKTFNVDERAMLKPGDTVVVKRRWF